MATVRQPPILDREIVSLAYTQTQLGGQIITARDPANDVTVWAGLRPLTANNQLSLTDGGLSVLTSDRVYVIRHDDLEHFPVQAANAQSPGMADDDGNPRFIIGHAQQGRQRYYEILCRLVGV